MALFVCLRFSDCLVRVATEADSVHTAVRVLEALGNRARTVVFYVVYTLPLQYIYNPSRGAT